MLLSKATPHTARFASIIHMQAVQSVSIPWWDPAFQGHQIETRSPHLGFYSSTTVSRFISKAGFYVDSMTNPDNPAEIGMVGLSANAIDSSTSHDGSAAGKHEHRNCPPPPHSIIASGSPMKKANSDLTADQITCS